MHNGNTLRQSALMGPPVYRGGVNPASVTQRVAAAAPLVYRPAKALPHSRIPPRPQAPPIAQLKPAAPPVYRPVAAPNLGKPPAHVATQRLSAPVASRDLQQQRTVQRSLRIEYSFWHPYFRTRVQAALSTLAGGAGQLVFNGDQVQMAQGAGPQAGSPSRQLIARIIASQRTVRIRRTSGHNRCEPVGPTVQQALQSAANGN